MAAAAVAGHGVELAELGDAGDLAGGVDHLLHDFALGLGVVGEELVEFGIEQTDGGGQSLEGLEDAGEVFA